MVKRFRREKWTSCSILLTVLDEVKTFSQNPKNGFANSSQFIQFAVRTELDRRKRK